MRSVDSTMLNRPVGAWVLALLICLTGAWCLLRLPVRQYPAIDPPQVSIRTDWLGASAETVENDITKRIEEAVAAVPGVGRITAVSAEGTSRVDLDFAAGTDLSTAASDVRDQIGRIRRLLPRDAEEPAVEKASSSSSPLIWFAISSEVRDTMELTDLARRQLSDGLATVPGVARLNLSGERRPALRVWVDPEALAARGLAPDAVARRLAEENLELPAGRIEGELRELGVRADARLPTPEAVAALILRRDATGEVRLGDVARVERGPLTVRSGLRLNGREAIGLSIVRQSTANSLETARLARARMDELARALPEDVRVTVAFDESAFVEASIHAVVTTLVEAVALVAVVMLVFLGSWRTALVPMLAVPVSLACALPIMAALGYSVNTLTLLAFVLAIGLVVDDAIVVVENAHRRHRQLGESVPVAVDRGTRQVAMAVIATTAVLAAVFIPVSLQEGQVGRLFREFGITLAAAVAGSAVVALTLTPVATRSLLPSGEPGRFERLGHRVESALQTAYAAALDLVLRRRLVALGLALALLAGGLWCLAQLKRELAPVEDQGVLRVQVEAPLGSTAQATTAIIAQVEQAVRPFTVQHAGAGAPIANVLAVCPSFSGNGAVNSGVVILRLAAWEDRAMSAPDLLDRLRPDLARIPGARITAANPPGFGLRDGGVAVQAVVGADEQAQARAFAQSLAEALQKDAPALTQVRADADLTRPELAVTIDRDALAAHGVTAADVAVALAALSAERIVGSLDERGRALEIVVQSEPALRRDPADLQRIHLRSAGGRMVPLSAVVRLDERGAARDLRRVDRRAAVTVSANLATGATVGDGVAAIRAAPLGEGASLDWNGQAREFVAASASSWPVFAAAVVVAWLVIAALAESWIIPLAVLAAVPLAVGGAAALLLALGMSLNLYAQIGLVMLVGLVAKNGVLIVDVAQRLRAETGADAHTAVRTAALQRLRPIVMTTVAGIAGAIPLALAGGAGAEGRAAIAVTVIGGLAAALPSSTLLVPLLYRWLARNDPGAPAPPPA